jgi:hypothetical protein
MDNNKDRAPLEHYRALYSSLDPIDVSRRIDMPFDERSNRFIITLLTRILFISWPEFSITPASSETCPAVLCSGPTQILLLRYLIQGMHAPSSGRFLSYRELPWGEVYDMNFQGRCVKRLAFRFGSRLEDFARAAESLGGVRLAMGDASYELPFFPDLKIRLIMRSGDEEFPPTSQFLFSDNTALAFSAEDLAVVGDIVIESLKDPENRKAKGIGC